MNEYNERILKNILQDSGDENDQKLLKEIEAAANNPLYQNKPDEAKEFAKKYGKSKTKKYKILSSVAAVLLILVIGVSVVPVNVEGSKNTIVELVINNAASDSFVLDFELFLKYRGQYIPTYIPEGYYVNKVLNSFDSSDIDFRNSQDKLIMYSETSIEATVSYDDAKPENIKNIKINGYDAIYIDEDGIQNVIMIVSDMVLHITTNDPDVDLINFAKLIKKR